MRCDGSCGISSISVETKRMACDGLQTQTLDLSEEFQQYTRYIIIIGSTAPGGPWPS
jgi:hypothetical protein